MNWLLIGGVALCAIGVAALWLSARLYSHAGIPGGRVIYSDTGHWHECPEPLYSPSVNLSGKPDYLLRRWQYTIPIEVKSCPPPDEPYRSHVLQMAAYCLLVEETFERRPPYGLIHYPGRTFAVNYTAALERELLDTIEQMRDDLRTGGTRRNHNAPARCRACGYAAYCDQTLA